MCRPLPVIAGYLAFVGYFCCAAGIAQGTSLEISAPHTLRLLWQHPDSLPKAAATLACALAIFTTLRVWKSAAALPVSLIAIPVLWYIGLAIHVASRHKHWRDVTQALADSEWSAPIPEASGEQFYEVYRLLASDNIDWTAVAKQIPTMLALCFVCSFGTSMDVIAGALIIYTFISCSGLVLPLSGLQA
jgi:sulfate permease, SulP family